MGLESSLKQLDSILAKEDERQVLRQKVEAVASLFPDGFQKTLALGRINSGITEAEDSKISRILRILRE